MVTVRPQVTTIEHSFSIPFDPDSLIPLVTVLGGHPAGCGDRAAATLTENGIFRVSGVIAPRGQATEHGVVRLEFGITLIVDSAVSLSCRVLVGRRPPDRGENRGSEQR